MASNMVRTLMLLVLGCLGALFLDALSASSQQLDFGRQTRREAIQESQRSSLAEILEKTGEVMDEIQQADFSRQQKALDAEVDRQLKYLDAQVDRENKYLDDHYVYPSDLTAEEEAARNEAARNTAQQLVNSYCSINSTASDLLECQRTATLYNLPRNYMATFFALFPEFDPSSAAYRRDLKTLLGIDS